MTDINRDGSDELDVQALLDKYLPDDGEDAEFFRKSDENADVENSTFEEADHSDVDSYATDGTWETGGNDTLNFDDVEDGFDFEADAGEDISSRNAFFNEALDGENESFENPSSDDGKDVFYMGTPDGEKNGGDPFGFIDEVLDDAGLGDAPQKDVNIDGGKGVYESFDFQNDLFIEDENGDFAIDKDIMAEIMASESSQFEGVDGFEDIENVSGFDSTRSDIDSVQETSILEDTSTVSETDFADDGEEFETDGTDEDDYSKFVKESINHLDDEPGDTDLNLLVALGLEDSLDDKVGANKAKRMKKNYNKELEAQQEKDERSVRYEYKDPSQTREISEVYKKRYFGLKIKLVIAAVLTVFLMIYENLPIIGYQFAGFLDPAVYPVVYIMVDLQILLIIYAAAYEQFFSGFAAIFKGKPTPESIMSIVSVISVVYSVIAANTALAPVEPILFNFPAAICAFMSLMFAYLTVKREIFSFNVVSSKKPKYALRRLSSNEAAMEVAAFGDEASSGDVLKIEKVSFVDSYFFRTESANKSNSAIVCLSVGLSLVLSFIFGVYSKMMGSDLSKAFTDAYAMFVAALPVSIFFTYSFPFYKANLESYENDSTIVGENSLEEYSGASVMSFDDKLVFPSVGVKVQNIKVYNNYRFDRVLYYAASVFAKTGGPLADVFKLATQEMGYSDDVLLTGIGNGYIQTEVNGKSIIFGRAENLLELGCDIPDSYLSDPDDPQISVMFMIFKGKAVAKMNIVYELDADFEYTVKQLAGSGMSVCVKTLDPNVDEDMIKSKVSLDKYPIRVIRYASLEEIANEVERSDSGIVARGTSKSLLRTVTYCDRVLDAKRVSSFVCFISAIVTTVVFAVVLVTGKMDSIRSIYAAICQLFWLIPVAVMTKVIVK